MKPSFFDRFLATGFFSGYSPFAPGTMGALVATILWIIGYFFLDFLPLQILTGICIIVFTLGSIRPINRLEKVWGTDPSKVVVDEMVGTWICLLAVPNLPATDTIVWVYVAMAFSLFRLFDIFKPLGIRRMEDLPGGWGVMMDDILAGCWGFLVMVVCRLFF